jgi:hypothetical protein
MRQIARLSRAIQARKPRSFFGFRLLDHGIKTSEGFVAHGSKLLRS